MLQLVEQVLFTRFPSPIVAPAGCPSRSLRTCAGTIMVTVPVNTSPDHLSKQLLAVGKARDRAAFVTLFEYFAPRLKSFLLRQGTSLELVEEVVQETMVNVWRRADTFDPQKASSATWIFTIARNMRVDLLRKERRPAPDMDDPAFTAEPEPLAHELIERRQDTTRLREGIAALPADQRNVLSMAFLEGKAHGQIAQDLSLPIGTVKSRIRLAIARLRSSLGESE